MRASGTKDDGEYFADYIEEAQRPGRYLFWRAKSLLIGQTAKHVSYPS